jgi:gluconokinase
MSIIVVMGVSGSGKTTVAAGIASAEGWVLLEGDSFHPPSNIAKMRAGIPLTDDDRQPWLQAIGTREDEIRMSGLSAVVACSALKRSYRAILIGERTDVALVYLRGSRQVVAQRLRARKSHFMPPELLESQFATLEEPGPDEGPIIVDIDQSAEAMVADALRQWRERSR